MRRSPRISGKKAQVLYQLVDTVHLPTVSMVYVIGSDEVNCHFAVRNTKITKIYKIYLANLKTCISQSLRYFVTKLHSFTKFMMLFPTVLLCSV